MSLTCCLESVDPGSSISPACSIAARYSSAFLLIGSTLVPEEMVIDQLFLRCFAGITRPPALPLVQDLTPSLL